MNLIIKTVQNDSPCSISSLFEFTKVLHISNFKTYSNLCVQHFHSIICRFSKMKFVVIQLETCGSTQPCLALWTAEFCTCFFVYGRTCSPLPSHLIPPRTKYLPQHPILKHPQPTFLPHCLWFSNSIFPSIPSRYSVNVSCVSPPTSPSVPCNIYNAYSTFPEQG